MKNIFVKTGLLILAAGMMLSLTACGEPKPAELPAVHGVNPAEFAALEERIAAAEADRESYVYLINASVNGETVLPIDGETRLTVDAAVPEDMKLAQWTVNGESLNTLEESIEVTVSENTVIKAEFRPIKKVTCINCSAQFLNCYENNGGESFAEFVFEDDYMNTFTGLTEEGGSLLLCVQASIPAGKILDHWLINGQAMNIPGTVNIFNAYVTEAATFEPVYIDKAD